MANVRILYMNKQMVHKLTIMKYFIDIDFADIKLFDKAVEMGFKPEDWLRKNQPNQILIEKINLKEIESWD
jgi:hypothetical protein